MIVLGLTGSIGMGKSRAAKMLRMMRVPVHDSDKAVHDALLPSGSAFEAVARLFPSVVSGGRIDRKKLGGIVFADKKALKKLESVLHPAAQASQKKFIRSMQTKGRRIVCLEIPLLFETGAEERVDYVITVSSPSIIQRRRVMARKGMTEAKFKSIIESQWPDAEKRALSDFVIDTGLGYARTYRQLKAVVDAVKGGSDA